MVQLINESDKRIVTTAELNEASVTVTMRNSLAYISETKWKV